MVGLLVLGNKFQRDLETSGSLAVYAPLEGGFEGRYQRRLRAAGYQVLPLTARGLGDPAMYLAGVHGVRPPHLGKKTIGNEAAVGPVQFVPPLLSYHVMQTNSGPKGTVIWLLEGMILSGQELSYLVNLPQQDQRLKVVVEMGGDRRFSWRSLTEVLQTVSA
ncbi:MAG: NAD(P)H-quinone oxidoreductase subunit N [Cyanobacteria bacterium P01_H01_bin.121]